MLKGFSVDDGSVLFGLLADGAGDVLLKTDALGFIIQASSSLEALGIRLADLLVAPHISDLSRSSHSMAVREYCTDTLRGSGSSPASVEFPARVVSDQFAEDRWFSLTLRITVDRDGHTDGTIAIMRAIEPRCQLEDELLAVSMVDPLTGLGNRPALMANLSRLLVSGTRGTAIMFGIDRFRAITLRYGRSRSDEVLWAFSQFLRTILGEDTILARLDGDRFAAILPGVAPSDALELSRGVVGTFAELASDVGSDHLRLTASAGLAAMAGDCDDVLAQTELCLILSQAAGGARVELDGHTPSFADRRRIA